MEGRVRVGGNEDGEPGCIGQKLNMVGIEFDG